VKLSTSFKFLVSCFKFTAEDSTRSSKRETRNQKLGTYFHLMVFLAPVLISAGCRQQMADQPRYDPLESSSFFPDGQSARPLVPGTIARGELKDDAHFFTGTVGGAPAKTFPFPITLEVLQRGQERYNIYCSPCHARTGNGDGMIVRRGFTRPPSFHIPLMREHPPGHFFRIISQGVGAMPEYRQQVAPYDRWAIVAYIRALQLTYYASLSDISAEGQKELLEVQP
jgi:hypothetical protein